MKLAVSLVLVLLVLILMPTNSSAVFNGIPFTSRTELFSVVGLIFLLTNERLRHGLVESLKRCTKRSRVGVFVVCSLTIVFKFLTFVIQPTAGEFEVCYRHFNARSGVDCAPSFEPHPRIASHSEHFVRRSSSVPVIDFGPRTEMAQGISDSTWRLPFVNTIDFDRGFWSWVPEHKAIETFPFWAEFRGTVDLGEGENISIRYLGQGRVTANDAVYLLPPSYESESVIQLPPMLGVVEISVDFAYLATRLNSVDTAPPYAVLRVEKFGMGSTSLLRPTSPQLLSIVNLLIDLTTFIALGWLVWLLRKFALPLVGGLLLAMFCWFSLRNGFAIGVDTYQVELAVVAVMAGILALRQRDSLPLVLTPSIIATGLGMTFREIYLSTGVWPNLSDVLVRLRGNDHLVYHALAREMLETGLFRGGEDVFYFQPGIRYIFFALQFIFGESGVITGSASVVMIGLAILYLARPFRWDGPRYIRLGQILILISLIVWWSSSHTIQSAVFGLSEFGTWILLLFVFALLLRPNGKSRLWILAMSLAWIVAIRPNQGIAVLMLLPVVVFLYYRRGSKVRTTLLNVLFPFLGIVLLVPLHNLIYGGELIFLPSGHHKLDQAGWNSVFLAISDDESREFLVDQVRGLLYLPSVLPEIYSTRLALAVFGFGTVSLFGVYAGIRNWKRNWGLVTLLALVVGGQILPFLNYSLYRYFPIHTIAIYLTAVLSSGVLLVQVSEQANELSPHTSLSEER